MKRTMCLTSASEVPWTRDEAASVAQSELVGDFISNVVVYRQGKKPRPRTSQIEDFFSARAGLD